WRIAALRLIRDRLIDAGRGDAAACVARALLGGLGRFDARAHGQGRRRDDTDLTGVADVGGIARRHGDRAATAAATRGPARRPAAALRAAGLRGAALLATALLATALRASAWLATAWLAATLTAGRAAGGRTADRVGRNGEAIAEQERGRDRGRGDGDQRHGAANADGGDGRLEGDVAALAELAADEAEHADRGVDRELSFLGVRIVDELVDAELGVRTDGERRPVEKQELRLAIGVRRDHLVEAHVIADIQDGGLAARGRGMGRGIDRAGNADLLLLRATGICERTEAQREDAGEQQPAQLMHGKTPSRRDV